MPVPDSHPPLKLKDPFIAGVLAFLVPGLGHLYQGRTFKGLLYAVCILGTFAFGMRLGDGKVVHFNWHPEQRTWAYLCQFWAGLPALPALLQAQLRPKDAFEPNHVRDKLSASIDGKITSGNTEGTVTGEVQLAEETEELGYGTRQVLRGKVTGTLRTRNSEVPINGKLTDILLDPLVGPDRQRRISGTLQAQAENMGVIGGTFRGTMPRSLWNAYEAPVNDDKSKVLRHNESTELERAHFELGTRFELGVVYTMIAGLLNILALYDAVEGPAYEDDEEGAPKETPAV